MSDLNRDTRYYIGFKQVQAWPEERDGKPGYGVRYPDGYVSWSPAGAFESSHLAMGQLSDGSKISPEMVEAFIAYDDSVRMANHTVLLTTLRNGFTIITESACVDAKNYDHEIGLQYARKKAKDKVWEYLGFLLGTARHGVIGSHD